MLINKTSDRKSEHKEGETENKKYGKQPKKHLQPCHIKMEERERNMFGMSGNTKRMWQIKTNFSGKNHKKSMLTECFDIEHKNVTKKKPKESAHQ